MNPVRQLRQQEGGTPLRRLPTWGLMALGMRWIFLGEIRTGWFWHPARQPYGRGSVCGGD